MVGVTAGKTAPINIKDTRAMARSKRTPKPKRSLFEPSELQIHIAVVQHLKMRARRGVFWFHPANGNKRERSEGAKLKAMGVIPGVPDLIIIKDGKTFGLELKTLDGRPSHEQHQTMQAMDAAGAFTTITYGLDSALDVLAAWGVIDMQAKSIHAEHSSQHQARP